MTLFDFYLMCDNVDQNWTFDIRKNGMPICKENFYNVNPACRLLNIEYFKLQQEAKTCVVCLKA